LSLSEKKGVWTTNELVNECREQNFKEAKIIRAIANLVQSGRLLKPIKGEYEFPSSDQPIKFSVIGVDRWDSNIAIIVNLYSLFCQKTPYLSYEYI